MLKLVLELTQRQTTQLDQSLIDEAKTALKIWDNHKKNAFSISKDELIALLKSRKLTPEKIKEGLVDGENLKDLPGEFAFISAEEMEELDPDEKIGVVIGNFIFVSENIPEEYLPYVLLNLRLLVYFKESDPSSLAFRELGIEAETQKHWSANTFDIIAASKGFKDNPEAFVEFLKWRKSVERTGYFDRVDIGDALKGLIDYKAYKRKTHPNDRSKWTRNSWNLGTAISQFSNEFQARNRNALRINKCDYQMMELSKIPSFNPSKMVDALNQIVNSNDYTNVRKNIYGRGDFNITKVRKVTFEDEAILGQAELLTEYHLPAGHLLEGIKGDNNSFTTAPLARKTASALIDRISFFSRQKLMEDCGTGIVASLKQLKQGTGVIQSGQNLDTGLEKLIADLEDVNKCLDDIEGLEAKFKSLSAIAPDELIPTSVIENKKNLIFQIGRIQEQIKLISEINNEILRVSTQSSALIESLEA